MNDLTPAQEQAIIRICKALVLEERERTAKAAALSAGEVDGPARAVMTSLSGHLREGIHENQ
jgi:hypothetical protein